MPDKHYLTWDAVFNALDTLFSGKTASIYGVPKGGAIVAGHVANRHANISLTADPSTADIILDDIYDSGKTHDFYLKKYPGSNFIALYHRNDFDGSWIVFPWEANHPAGEESVQDNITRLLEYIGEDPSREGLQETPKRVIKSYKELFSGYDKNPEEIFTVFEPEGYDEIIIQKDIEMYSMCEHHMLPFYGKAHVAYIPGEKIVGISKLARLVDVYARRLQNQERITQQVTDTLMELLEPTAAACVIEARHFCMCARGVGKQNSVMMTSSMKGAFREDPAARQELMQLIKN